MSNKSIEEDIFNPKRITLIEIQDIWSDDLLELLIKNQVIETAMDLYQAAPLDGRSDLAELIKFLEYYLNILEEKFASTSHALIYPQDDNRYFEFRRNVISKALNKAGAEAGVYWSDEEISILMDLYEDGATDEEIGAAVGRTAIAVYAYRQVNKLPKMTKWTAEEKDKLRELFEKGESDEKIKDILKKPIGGIVYQRKKLKLFRDEPDEDWTTEEEIELKRLLRIGYTSKKIDEGKFLPNRTYGSILKAVGTYELTGKYAYQWTEDEENFLINCIESNYSDAAIAELFERPVWQIIRKRVEKGFWPEKDLLEEMDLIKFLSFEAHFSSTEISILTGINANTVKDRVSQLKKNPDMKVGPSKWTHADRLAVWNLYNQGVSVKDLSTKFQRTEKSIRHVLEDFRNSENNKEQ